MKYRADIDGLRAAAIVPVILYHSGLPFFPGGFVGVDVFFVISGYLISTLLLTEIDNGSLSIARFYERRVRRILPALICMIAACFTAGWFLLAPDDYRNLGRSAVAALLSFSNFFFLSEAGYFDTPTAEKPLLHTWSLGIEEQFYLLFPLYLVLITRYLRRWRLPITAALAVASFALCAAATRDSPTAAFFLPHMRAWELLLGALVAMAVRAPLPASRWTEAGGALGFALIVLSIVGYSHETVFPGIAAAVPTIGAALVIGCGAPSGTWIGALLSKPVPVFLGKISYSLYLWHLPLLAFGYYLGLGTLSPGLAAILLVATFGIAILSWRFVELPARNARVVSRAALLRGVGASAGMLYVVGLLLISMNGLPGRVTPEAMQRLALIPDRNDDRQGCYMASRDAREVSSLCVLGAGSRLGPSFVVWGDSHAEALRGPLDIAARKFGRSGIFAGERGCAPLLGIQRLDWTDCRAVNGEILAMIKRESGIRTVVLIARWGMWAERDPYKSEAGPGFTVHLDGANAGATENHVAFAAGLERTILELRAAGKEIWLVGPVPEIGYNVPRSFFLKSLGLAQDLDLRPKVAEFRERQDFALRMLGQFAESYDIKTIFPHEALCDAERCRIQQDGRSLYFDDDHLSRFGADTLAGLFDPIFDSYRSAVEGEPEPGPVH